MSEKKIRVLIVDDSALMRKLISNTVKKDPEIEVADTAINGLFALKKIKQLEVDIILLDIEMPDMNGLEFLKMRRDLGIDIPVVMLSSLGAKRPEVTIEALDLGAKDFIIKPSGSISMDIEKVSQEIIAAIKKYGGEKYRTPLDKARIDAQLEKLIEDKVKKTDISPTLPRPKVMQSYTTLGVKPESLERKLKTVRLILIGISTGGPAALRQLFSKITNKKFPILVVQHMPPGFTREFAKGLNRISSLEVKEAADNDLIQPGWAYIAPGDHHLSVQQKGFEFRARITETPPVNGHRPSVEVLYESVADQNISSLGVIMTGMGKDGAKSLNRLHEMGYPTVAQSPKDCVVFGMPRVAIEMGGVDKVLEIDDIADFINSIG
jgi:two-component system chemotaxis response regulator CheB